MSDFEFAAKKKLLNSVFFVYLLLFVANRSVIYCLFPLTEHNYLLAVILFLDRHRIKKGKMITGKIVLKSATKLTLDQRYSHMIIICIYIRFNNFV